MNFDQIMNSIFGSDWLSNVLQILTGAACVIISRLYAKLKVKLINSNNDNAKVIGNLLENNLAITNKLEAAEKKNQELQEKQDITSEAVINLCNIVAMGFLDSKGVSPETKLAIGTAVGKLKEIGFDPDPIVEQVKENLEPVQEDIEQIIEDVKEASETAKENIEGIAEETKELYNKILTNEQ